MPPGPRSQADRLLPHTLVQACPWPKHAATYERMIRADHARRTLRAYAERLRLTATDTTLPQPAVR
jgi:hypothetical protein